MRWDGTKWATIPSTSYTGTASSGTIKASNIPTGTSMITFAALQKMTAYCPLESYEYTAPAVTGSGVISYTWTLTPSNVGKAVVNPTDNKRCVVSFDGTNPNVWDKAILSVEVKQNGTSIRKKSYRVVTYPRTPALNLPAYVCDKTLITLQVSDQYSRYAWYQDTDADPTSGLVVKQSGFVPATDSKYAFTPDKVANGGPYYINIQTYYTYPGGYKECPSLLLNPNKLITPISVTPGGVYRYPNK